MHVVAEEETANEKNTFVLQLQVTCKRQGTELVNDRGEPHHFADRHQRSSCVAQHPSFVIFVA